MHRYNPYQSAFAALTCPDAIQFYQDTAIDHTCKTLAIAFMTCWAVFHLGIEFRRWLEQMKATIQPQPVPRALPYTRIVGLLPIVTSATDLKVGELRELCDRYGLPTRVKNRRYNRQELISLLMS